MIEKFVELGICIFEGWIYFSFWNYFLKLRIKKAWFSFALMALWLGATFGINQMQIAMWNLIVAVILSISITQILFSDSVGKKAFYAILGGFISLCSEFIIMIIANMPLGKYAVDYSDDFIRISLIVISSKLLTFLTCRLVCYLSNSGRKLFFSSMALYFCAFPFACLVTFIGIANLNIDFRENNPVNTMIMFGCILLSIVNVILFIVYDRMVYMVNRIKEYEITEMKTEMENQHYIQLEEVSRKHTEILHNMNGYLKTIELMAREDNNNEIVNILTKLNHNIILSEEGYYSSHPILNAILNAKKMEAQLSGVECKIEIEPGFVVPKMDSLDLISTLSNLIGNAIEASKECEAGKILIQMFQSNNGRFSTIKINNNYQSEPIVKGGEFLTRKENSDMHGIGIRHTKKTVKKYDGWFNIEYGSQQFRVTLMFSNSEECEKEKVI